MGNPLQHKAADELKPVGGAQLYTRSGDGSEAGRLGHKVSLLGRLSVGWWHREDCRRQTYGGGKVSQGNQDTSVGRRAGAQCTHLVTGRL